MHGNVVRASGRFIAARAIANEALGPHPVDVLHCRRGFQVQHGPDIAGTVILRLSAIGDGEVVRQGFGGQEQGDVVEECRRVGGLCGRWPGEFAISRDIDRDLKVFWAFMLVSLVSPRVLTGWLASSERRVWLWGVNDGQTWCVDLAVDDGEVAHW